MKFVTYVFEGKESSGVLVDQGVIPFAQLLGKEQSLLAFMQQADEAKVASIETLVRGSKEFLKIPANDVVFKSPVPYPLRNVFCVGKNYVDHVKELAGFTGTADAPEEPVFFTKAAFPAIGTGESILLDTTVTQCLDYECELGVVIGKPCKNILPEDINSYIFGYTIVNDISARDLQKRHNQWFKGKSLDTCTSIGPWIVTKEEFSLPLQLDMSTEINGEVRQKSNTRNMIFDVNTLISKLCQGLTLYPGDIVATGTPNGVGQGFHPPKYLTFGDVVSCHIEKIGTLTNVVRSSVEGR